MQHKINQYFHNFADALTIYDYLGFALLLLLFLLSILLAIFARNRAGIAVFFALIAFTLLIAGPFGIKYAFDKIIRASSIEITKTQVLNFSDALVVDGIISNNGKVDFSKCNVKVTVAKEYSNEYLQALFNFKPLYAQSKEVDDIKISQSTHFTLVIDDFMLKEGFVVLAKGECYP